MSEIIRALESFPNELLLAIHGIDEESLAVPEKEGAWSVLQVIAHLCDFELQLFWRTRAIIATSEPQLPVFDQEPWVKAAHPQATKAELLRELVTLRHLNVSFLKRLPDEQLERKGHHAHYGELTLRGILTKAIEHQQGHLGQIRRVVATLGLEARRTDVSGAQSVVATQVPVRSGSIDGLRVREIWQGSGRHAQFIEIDPGAVYPAVDYHIPGPEVLFVVSGVFDDGAGQYDAGTFVHYPAGSSHVPQSRSGCSLFVFYPEG